MYTLHSNPPSPLWKKFGDSNPLQHQSRDSHVNSTSQLPITPVRVERCLKPKQAVMVAIASPRKEWKTASSAMTADRPTGSAVLAGESASSRLSQLKEHTFSTVPQTETSTQPLPLRISSDSQSASLPNSSNFQPHTNSRRKVARLLTFSDSSLQGVEDAGRLSQDEDSTPVMYSKDSLELSDAASVTSTEISRSGMVSPRFYDGLPISLEELLSSSSSDASASASPQQEKDLQRRLPLEASAQLLSSTAPSSFSQWQNNEPEPYTHPPPPHLAPVPLTPQRADTIIRPRASPVFSRHSNFISSQAMHSTPAVSPLRGTSGLCGRRGEVDAPSDSLSTHRALLLQPGSLSSSRVAMATNTHAQPVATPPPSTTLSRPNGFPLRVTDTRMLRAVNFRKFHLLKKVLCLWRAGAAVKKEQADLLHRKVLLRRGVKALWHNYRVAMETNKMVVWRLQQEKTRRYLHKWKLATKTRQMSIVRHFFLLWKRMRELQAVELSLTEAKNHALLSVWFLQWRDKFRFSLMEISASQFWRARVVQDCFTEWRIRRAQRESCAYAEEVVMVKHQSTMKRQVFQEWKMASNVRRRENAVLQMELLQEAFTYWRSFAASLGENKPGAVQSATDLRQHALLKKGFRKWLLKYRGQCFERKRGVGLLGSVFFVWHQQVVRRGRDVVSATAFNQQTLLRCCWVAMKQHCDAKCRRERVAVRLHQRVLLQRCFLGWRKYMYQATLHVVCEQLVEQKQFKRLQACFDYWVLSICQRRHEGTLSVCASWASEQASLRRAFTAWVAVGRCAGAQRRVQGWTGRRILHRCFNHWCAALKRHHALRRLVTAKTCSLKESTFRRWRTRVRCNEAERTSLRHQQLCVLKRSFGVWKGEYLKVHLSLTHGARYLKSLASRCLLVWRQRAVVRRRLRAASEHVLKMLELGRKREVLVLWRRKTARIKAVRFLSGLLSENLLRKCLQAWHNHTAHSVSKLEATFLNRLHQAIFLESHCSSSTPAVISVTPNDTDLTLGQPDVTSDANEVSPAPSIETVKRNLFHGSSLPSLLHASTGHTMTTLKSASAPMEEIATTGRNNMSRRLNADGGADGREMGGSYESTGVVALMSPASKLRILEESPSPTIAEGSRSTRGTPPLLMLEGGSESTAGHEEGRVSEWNEAVSLTPDSLEEETSFLSVNLCPCVSNEVRMQLQELDSALPLDSSTLDDDGVLEGMQPVWTEHEVDLSAVTGQITEANAVALSTIADVSLIPGAPSPPSIMTKGPVSVGLPKDSAVVNQLLRILHCWRLYPCGKVFYQWHCYAVWKKRLQKAYNTTSEHHRAGVLRKYLGAWKKRVQMCASLDHHCEKLSVSFAQRQLYGRFAHWRRHTKRLLHRSAAMGRVAEAHRGRILMRVGLHKWSKEVLRCKQGRVCLHKLNLRKKRVVFAAWRQSAVAQSATMKQSIQAANVFSTRIVLSCGFAQWTERLLALKKTAETATSQLHDQQNMTLLSRSYRHWKLRCALNHKQDSTAHILNTQHLLRRSMSAWRRHCIARRSEEEKMVVAADRFIAKRALWVWKRCLHARIKASMLSDQHNAKVVLRVSFNHWSKGASASLGREKVQATAAEEFHQRSTKSRYLSRWRKYVILQDAKRQEQCRLLLRRQRSSRLRQSFKTWKHQFLLAQRMYQLRAARRQTVLARCWGRWKALTLAALTAKKQHSTAVLLRSWRRWRISFVEQRTENEVVAAANRRRAQQVLKAWMSVSSSMSSPFPSPHCENSTVSLHSVPPLLGISTQSPSLELMKHIFNLWKYRARICTEHKHCS